MSTEYPIFWKSAQFVAKILTKLLFDLKVEGRHNIPQSGGVLIVSNHQSYLDAVVLAAFLKRPVNFVGQSGLFENRLGAWVLRRLNAFPLCQGKGDVGALKETIRRLRKGHVLNIYPEGTRSPDGQIHKFERGVALILRRAKVRAVPAVIFGAYEAWPMHRRIWRMAPIRVTFGPPLNLDGLDSDDDVTAAIERELRRMFHEIQQRSTSPSTALAEAGIRPDVAAGTPDVLSTGS